MPAEKSCSVQRQRVCRAELVLEDKVIPISHTPHLKTRALGLEQHPRETRGLKGWRVRRDLEPRPGSSEIVITSNIYYVR